MARVTHEQELSMRSSTETTEPRNHLYPREYTMNAGTTCTNVQYCVYQQVQKSDYTHETRSRATYAANTESNDVAILWGSVHLRPPADRNALN